MVYEIVVTSDAEDDLNRFLRYLLVEKSSKQAAAAVLDDFEATIHHLALTAGSIKRCDHPKPECIWMQKNPFPAAQIFSSLSILKEILQSWTAFSMNCRIMKTKSFDV